MKTAQTQVQVQPQDLTMTYIVNKLNCISTLSKSVRSYYFISFHKDRFLTMFLLFPCPAMLIKQEMGLRDMFGYNVILDFWENATTSVQS